MKQDTGKFRKNTKDQFYTEVGVAKSCISIVTSLFPYTSECFWVEPSAGDGAFLKNISYEKIGMDVDPKGDEILKRDFFTWKPPDNPDKDIIIIGNPPFGRQSSMAKAFIRRSCEFAKVIAFILPKSFTKPSMYGVFSPKFHLVHSHELEKNSFVINDAKYDVPCVFQVWEKRKTNRPIMDAKVEPMGFKYVKDVKDVKADYDAAFRRVGGLAGMCYKNDGVTKYSHQSHYFLKFDDGVDVDAVVKKINLHTFPSNTVGPRSLSKTEANTVINEIIFEIS